ncbi:MAG: proton-conducting transporter membrane subunit [Clostridia bacterium]|nr:proton-conducting transporter membrane subunit [Clostridia bacterium]
MLLAFLVFFPMIAAVVSYLVGRKNKGLRDVIVILSCLITLLAAGVAVAGVIAGRAISLAIPGFCGRGLSFALDGFRALYALVGAVMWLATSMLSREYFANHYRNRNRYYFFYLMTLGATLGVFLSDDLFTTFVFFEIMSFTSYTWVAHDETPGALRAAETYLAVAIIGGMVMLMGLFLLDSTLGTLKIGDLYDAAAACGRKGVIWAASLCILFGFGAKAGMFPLHIWLPKAHPVAPAPASALLSGILTKSGIFGVIVVSANIFRNDKTWGNLILVLGLITMLGGAVLAVFSVNLKRTLACSSMSQIGFILTGIAMSCLLGEENALAVRGALLYMVNHSLFKLILFMAAGVVYMNLHKLNLNDVRGFGRRKPLLHFAFLMGAVGLMGVPLFSGYVSKTLIHEGIVEYVELLVEEGTLALSYKAAEWIYLFSGGLTSAYMIKLYICLFWQKHPTEQIYYDARKRYMSPLSALALTASALLVPLLGVRPNLTMDALADFGGAFLHAAVPAHAVHYFSLTNLKGAGISLAIGLIVYLAVIRPMLTHKEADGSRTYLDLWPAWLDIEERAYRPAIGALLSGGGALASLCSEDTLEGRIYRPLIRVLVTVGSVASKTLGSLTDAVAYLIGHTVLAMRRRVQRVRVGNRVTDAVGRAVDGMADELNHTVLRGHPVQHHATGSLAGRWDGIVDALRQTTHTMSYGLLLFGLGLCATLIYLLIH